MHLNLKRWEDESIISNYCFVQTAPVALHMIMMAAIEEEDTPDLHPLACLLTSGMEEVALTPDPTHAQDHIPPVVVAQGHGRDLGLVQGHILPVVAALGLDHVHGQDQGQMSVEGELLGGGGDRWRGR